MDMTSISDSLLFIGPRLVYLPPRLHPSTECVEFAKRTSRGSNLCLLTKRLTVSLFGAIAYMNLTG